MNAAKRIRYSCPACNTTTDLLSDQLNSWVCTCREVPFVKDAVAKTTFLTKLELQLGPLQPGTRGNWQNRPFTLTGCVRIWCSEVVLNYWTVLFDDGTIWYLEQGYGFYAFLKPDAGIAQLSAGELKKINVDSKPVLKGEQPYLLISKNDQWKAEIEGAVRMPAVPKDMNLFHFAADDGTKICILQWDALSIETCSVGYVNSNEFQFTNLRQTDASAVHRFQCSECAEQIVVQSFPYALSCACKRCGTGYHYLPFKGFSKVHKRKVDFTPQFDLGVTGVVDGINWQVVGCVQKEEDNSYHAQWREYTLYNEAEGYAFLSEFDGHWIYLREQVEAPVLYGEAINEFTFKNEPFTIFNRYRYKVITAAGEFPYDVFNNNATQAKEYISPPEIWIREKNSHNGIVWFFGRHMSRRELKNAFPLAYELPHQVGTGAVQPTGYKHPMKLVVAAALALLLLLLLHVFFANTLQNETVYQKQLSFIDSTNQVTDVSPTLQLRKRSSNMKLIMSAPVRNSWVSVNATLVNTVTGKEYTVEEGIEFYQGYSDGESWSEGSTRSDAYFTAIPAGSYKLQIQALRDGTDSNIGYVEVDALYDVEASRNLVIPALFIIAWAVGSFYISQIFERQRWSNSPFSTYTYHDE